RRFAEEGAQVVMTDADEQRGQQAAAELGLVFETLDVRSESRWEEVFLSTIERYGGVDVLVNNAGYNASASVETETLEGWQTIMDVDATGVFLGCRSGVRHMKERGGSIINFSSVAAMKGRPNEFAYCAAKGAVRSMTKSIA